MLCVCQAGTEGATPGFRAALSALCRDLAVAMVRDGEGATKTLVFNVTGAKDEAQARTIARAVINSSLVKTALYGEDPNWGRVIAAAGAARAGLDAEKWSLKLGGQQWVEVGAIEAMSEPKRTCCSKSRRSRSPSISASATPSPPAGAATSPRITYASTRTTGHDCVMSVAVLASLRSV